MANDSSPATGPDDASVAAPSKTPFPEPDERRISERRSSQGEVTCRIIALDSPPPFPAKVEDVSATGMRLLFAQAFEPGTLLTITLPAPEGAEPTSVLAYVRHSSPRPGGVWAVGCAFALELDEDMVASCGGSSAPAAVEDRRRWERWPGTGGAALRLLTERRGIVPVRVLNLSVGGVGMLSGMRLEPGATAELRLFGKPGTQPVQADALICHVSPSTEGGWLLGCTFIRKLGEHELALLI
jgi:hypothetical protein